MPESRVPVSTSRSLITSTYIYYKIVFIIILLLVVINVFTPLRLNTDGIRYLNILEYLKGDFDSNSIAAHDFLPHGYPWLLQAFDKLHLLCPAIITLVNIIAILGGSYFVACLFAVKNKWLYLGAVQLCFICIKHYTLPLADEVFTFIILGAVYCWDSVFKGNRYLIAPALLISALAMFFRTAGISVIIGIILYLLYCYRGYLLKYKIVIMCLIALLTGVFILFALNIHLVENHIDYIKQLDISTIIKDPATIINRLAYHMQELGEMVVNVPFSKLSGILGDKSLYLFIVIGVVSIVLLIRVIVQHKYYRFFPFWVFFSYMLMILVWPFYDTRFMLPVTPFLIYFLMEYLSRQRRKYITILAASVYFIFGLMSVIYSDALSVNKAFFLKHYGADQNLTNAYRIHFENEKVAAAQKPQYDINKDNVLFLLEKFDRPLIK